MTYFNTNKESGTTLAKSEAKAKTQEGAVYRFFETNPTVSATPSHVQNLVLATCPLTSVRRALTNLTNAGKLIKTPVMADGSFGKKVHTWRLKRESHTLF